LPWSAKQPTDEEQYPVCSLYTAPDHTLLLGQYAAFGTDRHFFGAPTVT
jgi:hypothetical protein